MSADILALRDDLPTRQFLVDCYINVAMAQVAEILRDSRERSSDFHFLNRDADCPSDSPWPGDAA